MQVTVQCPLDQSVVNWLIIAGKDWVDKTKLVEVEAQRREAFVEGITETRNKLNTRIEEAEKRKQLKD